MRKIKWIISAIFAALVLYAFPGCDGQPERRAGLSFETISFRDIPGVTEDEIAAVEALKQKTDHFVFGTIPNAEAVLNINDERKGYSILLSKWLTTVFGIPFVPTLVTRNELFEGLENGKIDFTGYLMPTDRRRQVYHMTDAIAYRPIEYFRIAGSESIAEIAKTRMPRYALLDASSTSYNISRHTLYEFEPVFISEYVDAYQLLKNGEIDALVAPSVAGAVFIDFDDIVTSDFLPVLHSSIALSTQTDELKPIVDIVQKVLENGGIDFFNGLHKQGHMEYMMSKLHRQLSKEELEFIRANPVIPFGAEFDNYPLSFYNSHVNEWQGIAFDVLREVEALTGLEFSIAHEHQKEWDGLLKMLEDGDILMVTELLRTPQREGRFLWPESALFTSQAAFISTAERHSINLYEALSMRVGLRIGTGHTDYFWKMFPQHQKTTEFGSVGEAFAALNRGEIDIVMDSYNLLLYYTHYLEFPGYRASFLFSDVYHSTFGFNKNADILCSIVEKALAMADTRVISEQWLRRTHDYRVQLALAQRPWMIGATVLLLFIAIILTVFLIINSRKSKIIATQKTMASCYEYANKLSKTLSDITKSPAISAGFLKGASDLIAQEGCAALNVTRVGTWIATEKRDMLKNISSYLSNGEFVIQDDFDLTICEKYTRLFETERLIVTDNVRTSEIWADIVDDYNTNLCAILDVPVRIDGKLAGAVCLEQDCCEMYPKERKWTIEEQNFASSLADLMALALSSTERRAARDAAVTANRAKTDFLATMSHEIRTPMNSIMGFAELAMDGAVEPQMKDYLSKITDSTRWLLHIINDILDISKVESGKMELENIPFDLHDVISRCQSVALPNIKEKGLDLKVYTEPLIGKNILGDPIRLYQVLMNLLSNAVKFTNTGTIKMSTAIKSMDNGNATINFEIKDSGIGMSPEQTKKIFEPFVQADSSTTRNYGGTGLGLAITKNIVELMNGKLTVESNPGYGSTFSFEIAFETVDASNSTINGIGYKSIERPQFDGLILVCDDNPMNQQVACEHLSRVGLKTMVANNGKEAVDIVTERIQKGEKPFDLILMDIFMPIMDGIEAASTITAFNTGTPIIAMTANIMVNELEVYKKNGMPDFLGKPFTAQELWRSLLKYLTPTGITAVDNNEQARDMDELLHKLQINFVKNKQNLYSDIVEAIALGNLKLAHRLAHTLKGNAGQIGKTKLQNIAAEIEASLQDGATLPTDEKMDQLKNELALVLEELQQTLDKQVVQTRVEPLDAEQVSALFEKIEPMLKNINPAVVNLLDDIRAIPGTEELVQQVENYNFESAVETLAKLKTKK